MLGTKTTYCARCAALSWIEDWHEMYPEKLSIVLGPCGHVIERSARLEWSRQRARPRSWCHEADRGISRRRRVYRRDARVPGTLDEMGRRPPDAVSQRLGLPRNRRPKP